jgi:hypothetical protein
MAIRSPDTPAWTRIVAASTVGACVAAIAGRKQDEDALIKRVDHLASEEMIGVAGIVGVPAPLVDAPKGENIEVTIASDGKTTIVAIPKRAVSRRNQLSDDAYNCLKKCREIQDDQKRVQCIVLCPPNNDYQVFMY